MRYLFFTNTPAHVHLYKHVVGSLEGAGHEVLVLARDYGCTEALLDWFDLPYRMYGGCGPSQRSLFLNLPRHYARLLPAARRFDPDVVFGMGVYAAHAGAVTRAPTVLVVDSEPTGLDHALSRPFARAILTPAAFTKDLGPGHFVFSGFKESAYLHPDVFSPRDDVRARLGVGPAEPFVLVRFNAFGSHHDIGRGGFTPAQRRELVTRLSDSATVFVSDEGGDLDLESLPARAFDLHPALLHDALREAALLVADTQTMVTEAALLGTPAIRSNSFVGDGDMGNFVALQNAGLVHNLADFGDVARTAEALLEDGDARSTWARRRDAFVEDMVDLSALLVEVATHPGSVESIEALSRPPVRARGSRSTAIGPTRH